MKKVLVVTMGILLVSCNTYNDKMNVLLNKKSLLDKLKTNYHGLSSHYKNGKTIIFYEIAEKNGIEKAWEHPDYKRLNDSVRKYNDAEDSILNELNKTNYSIDSLSKLK